MSRWLDREEELQGPALESLSRSGGEKRERVEASDQEESDFGENRRERVILDRREYRVRRSERDALFELGRFRLIGASDLTRGVYGGNAALAKADLCSLASQHLVYVVSRCGGQRGTERIYTLSSLGEKLVTAMDPRIEANAQQIFGGYLKPAEIDHDVLLYRAYLREAALLRASGGRVRRVVLDLELKQKLASMRERGRGKKPYWELQAESARALSLPVVNGRVMIPDLRLEYEDERGQLGSTDLEVATGNYRQAQIALKASAGFRVYGSPSLTVDMGRHLKSRAFPDIHSMLLPL